MRIFSAKKRERTSARRVWFSGPKRNTRGCGPAAVYLRCARDKQAVAGAWWPAIISFRPRTIIALAMNHRAAAFTLLLPRRRRPGPGLCVSDCGRDAIKTFLVQVENQKKPKKNKFDKKRVWYDFRCISLLLFVRGRRRTGQVGSQVFAWWHTVAICILVVTFDVQSACVSMITRFHCSVLYNSNRLIVRSIICSNKPPWFTDIHISLDGEITVGLPVHSYPIYINYTERPTEL